MNDFLSGICKIRRPKLLMDAARRGIRDYNKDKFMERFDKSLKSRNAKSALLALLPLENSLEIARVNGDASYSPSRHVEILIAVLAEVKGLLQQPR